MAAFLMPIAVGLVLVMIGISNIKGNINSIHWYHRQRVKEEDKAVFGKLMGIGTILCGAGVIAFGLLSLAAELTGQMIWMTIGSYLMVVCLVAGIGLFTYTTIKYNKGIF